MMVVSQSPPSSPSVRTHFFSSIGGWAIVVGGASFLVAVVALVVSVSTQQTVHVQKLSTLEKIQATETSLVQVRASQDEVRQLMQKQVEIGETRLADSEKRYQELVAKGDILSRELDVVSSQWASMAAKVEKANAESLAKITKNEEGIADLKRKAVFPVLAPIGAQQVTPRPASPVGIRIKAGLLDPIAKSFFTPTGMRVYLVREPLENIAHGYGISGSVENLTELWVRKLKYPGTTGTGELLENSIQKSALATCVLGADGEGQTMEPPARGSYWLIGATPLGSGFVFEKAISVQTGKELFILNSADQAKER